MQPQHTHKTEKKLSYKQYTEQQFIDECNACNILDSSERQKFINYWSEKTPSGKMLFQTKPTWETPRRMTTWKNNGFGKSQPAPAHKNQPDMTDPRYQQEII